MKNDVKLVIKVEFQYFGEIIGSLPYLRICYQAPNGIISHANGIKRLFVNRPNYLEKCTKLDEKLLAYQNPFITFQYHEEFIDCIGLEQNLVSNVPYNDNLYVIAKLIADIYYGFNGEKIGISLPQENKDLVSIYINKYKLELTNNINDYYNYDQLLMNILNSLNVNLNNFNYTSANGISDHRGINVV